MTPYWMIFDWAGNAPFGWMLFTSFEDAWAHIYKEVPEALLNTYDDYYVEEVK